MVFTLPSFGTHTTRLWYSHYQALKSSFPAILFSSMTTFLQLVSQDLRQKLGEDLSRTVVVFPNKRAELFMNEFLVLPTDERPIWAPRYQTINDLFHSLSDLTINDPIDTVCRLYHLYVKQTGEAVSLDLFYGWAERLLADFDDVDKNMADAKSLFQNINDYKAFDHHDYLTEEQIEVLRSFFKEFDPSHQSELRDKFRRLWNALHPLYEQLNAELLAEGLAYEGAMFRRVVQRLEKGEVALDASVDQYIIVGFNVLDQVEQRLFSFLKKEGKARFYWDYDEFYAGGEETKHFEAGLFVRENLLRFPNELGREHFDNLRHLQSIEMVAASTEVVQAQSVGPWLEENLTADPKRTAVVLCNENILQPVLHSLPDNVDQVNITKGFPLGHTEASTEVEQKFSAFEKQTTPLSTLEMIDKLIALIEESAKKRVSREDYSTENFDHILQTEAYYLMTTLLTRLRDIATSGRLDVSVVVLRRIVRQIIRQATIPFQGEPIAGLQILGVLETRCLDFEHIIMLSVNEGTLPQKSNDNSFIPYLLRKAFGLTTPERRTAVYAYYFYRLIQRAKRLRLLYNTSSEGMVQGEMSRFMTQLLVESPLKIQHRVLTSSQTTLVHTPEAVEKPANLVDLLTPEWEGGRATHPRLSPSAINTYLRCQLLFYYQYVAKYREPDPDPEVIQPNTLGSVFHYAAEQIYKALAEADGGVIRPEKLALLQKDDAALEKYIRDSFAETPNAEYQLLEANVIKMFLKSLLEYDRRNGAFTMLCAEKRLDYVYQLPSTAAVEAVSFKGFIDRLDTIEKDGRQLLRIIDYKTGGKVESAKSIEEIFEIRGQKQKHYMLQTFLYSLIMMDEPEAKGRSIAPALFFVNHARQKDYSPYLTLAKEEVLNFEEYAAEFRKGLDEVLTEIFDPEQTFAPIKDPQVCKSCKYYSLCYQ